MVAEQLVLVRQVEEHEGAPETEEEAGQDDDGQVQVGIGWTQVTDLQESAHAENDHQEDDDGLDVWHLEEVSDQLMVTV